MFDLLGEGRKPHLFPGSGNALNVTPRAKPVLRAQLTPPPRGTGTHSTAAHLANAGAGNRSLPIIARFRQRWAQSRTQHATPCPAVESGCSAGPQAGKGTSPHHRDATRSSIAAGVGEPVSPRLSQSFSKLSLPSNSGRIHFYGTILNGKCRIEKLYTLGGVLYFSHKLHMLQSCTLCEDVICERDF